MKKVINMYDEKRNMNAQIWLICLLGLGLFGCPDQVQPEVTEKDMAPEEDMTAFTFDLDPVEEDMSPVDMMPIEEDMEVVEEDRSCDACKEDSDCGSGYLCVAFDEDAVDKRCFRPCGEESDDADRCGDGFSCLGLTDELEICVADEGSCELCYDPDGDGYGPGGFCPDGDVDCDSTNRRVNPDRDDDCDGVDNDCDGTLDEDFEVTECGIGSCQAQSACVDGVEQSCVPPEVQENDSTCNGFDDDCDGNLDEDFVPTSCGEGVCTASTRCFEGAETACEPGEPTAADDLSCDGLDDDCDGNVDESFSGSCGEGACIRSAACSEGVVSCIPRDPDPEETDSSCNNFDDDCDGSSDEGFVSGVTCGIGACQVTETCVAGGLVCEPLTPAVTDDTTCDGVDNDCDGEIDEDCHVNALRVEYNAELSDASSVALDVYYDQLVSPSTDPAFYQPTTLQLTIAYPSGMSHGVALAGSSLLDSEKSVNQPVFMPSGSFQVFAFGNGAASAFPIPSSAQVGSELPPRDGKLVTMFFNINGVQPPWTFSWVPEETFFSPVRAMSQYGPVLDENGNPTVDGNGDPVEQEVRRILELGVIAPITP